MPVRFRPQALSRRWPQARKREGPPGQARTRLGRPALQAPSPTQRSTAKWDPRIYGIGAQILRDLGVGKMKLLASPRRMPSMTGFDLEVTSYVASPEQLG